MYGRKRQSNKPGNCTACTACTVFQLRRNVHMYGIYRNCKWYKMTVCTPIGFESPTFRTNTLNGQIYDEYLQIFLWNISLKQTSLRASLSLFSPYNVSKREHRLQFLPGYLSLHLVCLSHLHKKQGTIYFVAMFCICDEKKLLNRLRLQWVQQFGLHT